MSVLSCELMSGLFMQLMLTVAMFDGMLLFTEMLEYTDDRHPWETMEDRLTDIR